MKYFFFQRPALVFSLAGLTALACLEVPIFISLFCIVLWTWKWLAEQKMVAPIPRKMTTALSVFLFIYIFIQYRTLLEQEASSALLVALASLKVMDYSNRRDHLLLILLGFLLLTLKPLYGLDLYWLPVQLICMMSLWLALSQDNRKLPRGVVGKIFLASLPIAALLFFIFPRVVFPWAASQSRGNARMGFSTDLNPGEVSKLASSNDLVMRARFPNNINVDPRELYWKGGVLTISDGMNWKAKKNFERAERRDYQIKGDVLNYEVILQPGQGNWIFVLDPTHKLASPGNPLIETEGRIWRTIGITNQAVRFYGESSAVVRDTTQPTEADLQHEPLPPFSQHWVNEVKASSKTFAEKRAALQKFFSQSDFVYTLNPGIYKKNPLDEFLFGKRRGFCEHFAGAFATLARAMGIPARVISGYQGAEYNALGDFWRVTQKQAHAWVEVWNGSHWIRQDPTVWVPNSEFSRYSQKSFYSWIDESFDTYEALNYRWTTFLLDFDKESQSLAMKEWFPRIFLGIILILIGFFLFRVLRNNLFAGKSKLQVARQHHLSVLVRQIKELEEDYLNQDLSHIPPLQILKSAEKHSESAGDFYQRVHSLYDRAFYQGNITDSEMKTELSSLEKKWMDLRILNK